MRSHTPCKSSRAARRRSGLLRMLADSQAGFTIIEVVVASVMLTLMAGAVATALISTADFSGDQRRRSQADEIAQQDQERLKGMTIKALSGLSQQRCVSDAGAVVVANGPCTGAGNNYTVTSTGKFLSNTGTSSCASSGAGAAAYVLIHSEVDWTGNVRPPVSQESLITPRPGGTILADVIDQDSNPLQGATVTVYHDSKDTASATTNGEGCAIFTSLGSPAYFVFASKSGYVSPDGVDYVVGGTSVSTGTSFPVPNPLQIGQAGAVTANFTTTVGGTTYSGQTAPSIAWFNAGMSASKNFTPSTVPSATISSQPKLFPFNNGTAGVYTDNYTVWAGKCDAAKPPSSPAGSQSFATVAPGATAVLDGTAPPGQPQVKEPGLILKVTYAGSPVTPDHIELKDSCNQIWFPDRRIGDPNSALGQLKYPGQPYGTYTVCADYDPPGSTPRKQMTVSGVANTNLSAGNPTASGQTIAITGTTNGLCALS